MYSIYSYTSSLIVLSYAFLSFFYYHQDFGWEIPFYDELTNYCSIGMFFLLILRAQIRWQKLWITRNSFGYLLTSRGWKKAIVNESLQLFMLFLLAIMLLTFLPNATIMALALICFIVEGIGHLFLGKKTYKMIINNQAILIISNKQKTYYINTK